MRLKIGDRAPYAPGQVVVDLIRRQRQAGNMRTIDATLLARVGVTESLTPRTLASLRMLGFIDDDNNVTPVMEGFKRGTDDEYRQYLADHIKAVYAEVFEVIGDPAQAAASDIEDAFRGFEPHGQRGRMVVLFLSLCQEAGLITEVVRDRPSNVGRTAAKKKMVRRVVKKPTPNAGDDDDDGDEREDPKDRVKQPPTPEMDPLIAAYFAKLPAGGTVWPTAAREKYLAALSSIFDIVYEDGGAS